MLKSILNKNLTLFLYKKIFVFNKMYVDFKKTYLDLNKKPIGLNILFVEGLQNFFS